MAKEEFLSIRIIKIKAYRNHPKLIWAPAPQVFNLKLNKHLWLVSVGDASWLNFHSSPYQRGPTRVSGRGLICGKKTFNSRSSVRALQASGKRNCQKTTKNNTSYPSPPPHSPPKPQNPDPQTSTGGEMPPDTAKQRAGLGIMNFHSSREESGRKSLYRLRKYGDESTLLI